MMLQAMKRDSPMSFRTPAGPASPAPGQGKNIDNTSNRKQRGLSGED